MLRWRLTAAAAILLPLFLLLWLDDQWNGGRPGIWLTPIALLFGVLACHEVGVLLEKAGLATAARANRLAVFILLLSAAVPVVWRAEKTHFPGSELCWILWGIVVAVGVLFLLSPPIGLPESLSGWRGPPSVVSLRLGVRERGPWTQVDDRRRLSCGGAVNAFRWTSSRFTGKNSTLTGKFLNRIAYRRA